MSQTDWPHAIDANEAPPLDADRLILWLARRQWRTILGGVLFGGAVDAVHRPGPRRDRQGDRRPRGPGRAGPALSGPARSWAWACSARHHQRPALVRRANWLSRRSAPQLITERAVARPARRSPASCPPARSSTVLRQRRDGASAAPSTSCAGSPARSSATSWSSVILLTAPPCSACRAGRRPGAARLPGPHRAPAPAPPGPPARGGRPAHGLGADTVAGLRVLRGIGGEQTFLRRYAAQSQRVRQPGVGVAGIQAALDAAQVLLPGIFVVW